jgi:1,4-dihydroxy-2-naphthoyl-CoA hydrolase
MVGIGKRGALRVPITSNHTSVEALNQANKGKLPGHLGLVITTVEPGRLVGRFEVRPDLVAHTGFLLAGTVLSIADILCAYGVSTVWPAGASGFTTAEVKCNFIGTLTEGAVVVSATMLHGGRTTQIWDAAVEDEATGRLMAVFRCTQIILYPRA